MSENRSSDAFLAFLLGGAVGGALALLLAPCEGSETRRRVMDWLESNKDKARELLDREREKLHNKGARISAAADAARKAYRETA